MTELDYRVVVQPDNSATLAVVIDGEAETIVSIAPEHRPAVALALLGGVTDDLVRRAVEGALDGPGVHDDADWDAIRPMVDPLIRGALAAIFGPAAK